MTDAQFGNNFVRDDSPILSDTMIDLIRNLNTYYMRWLSRTLIINNIRAPVLKLSFVSFSYRHNKLHSSTNIKFSLVHSMSAAAILKLSQ